MTASDMPDTPLPPEDHPIPRGFAAARVAVILDAHVRQYVESQQERLPQSKSWSALIRDLLREHEALREETERLRKLVATQQRRIQLLQLTVDRPHGRD